MAQVWALLPAVIWSKTMFPETSRGIVLQGCDDELQISVLGAPSWPLPSQPQQYAVPSLAMAQVWAPPAVTWSKAMFPETARGIVLQGCDCEPQVSVVGAPSWPV